MSCDNIWIMLPRRKRLTTFLVSFCFLTIGVIVFLQKTLVYNDTESARNVNNNKALHYENYIHEQINLDDLNVIKNNLAVMRKVLEANKNLSASEDKSSHPDIHPNTDSFIKSKQFLEENADTLIQIADFIKHTDYVHKSKGVVNQETFNVYSGSQDIEIVKEPRDHYANAQDIQKEIIRNLEPVYVDFEAVDEKNTYTEAQQKQYELSKEKLQQWDLFFVKFPDEQSQDAILKDFILAEDIVNELIEAMKSFRAKRKAVKIPKPVTLYGFIHNTKEKVSWRVLHEHISQYWLYNPRDPVLKQVLEEMAVLPLTDVMEPSGGTQQKLLFYLANDLRVIFKPMRFSRKQEALPDHMFWRDFERHYSEIAAFHLDMVLGFHRVPPTIGRYVNVTADIEQLDTDKNLIFFRSPAGNKCFYGKCEYYCDTAHAVCGRPEMMQGSVMMYLPSSKIAPRVSWRHPWRRTYSKTTKKANFEKSEFYCDGVRRIKPYNNGRRLLDLMDMAVFDFLIGNMDRHHYETFEFFGNDSFPILFDNGRGYGKTVHDELSILAPIYQCCLIRYNTLQKLVNFQKGPKKLSDAMRKSLQDDRASPVLLEKHLHAMDRRVAIILKTIHKCLSSHHTVIQDDGF